MKLLEEDIRTREVLSWRGVHLLHAFGSSCSQKVRIFLNLKEIPWESHLIDLKSERNHESWYLGINPRGLVPALVHDGVVHIESNDILEYLEDVFPEPALIPSGYQKRVSQLLHMENELHVDLRTLTFRYVLPTLPGAMKSERALENLRGHHGTVGGKLDRQFEKEVQFWEGANRHGIADEQVRQSVSRFKAELSQFDKDLQDSNFLLGDRLTVLDVAWYVYTARLIGAGYPLHTAHPQVSGWFARLDARPEFHREVEMPAELRRASREMQQAQDVAGKSLKSMMGHS